jgi:hypothetical protein
MSNIPDFRDFRSEVLDKIREQSEIMNNEIAFSSRDAVTCLGHASSFAADLIADQVCEPLDGINFGGTSGQSFANNLFFHTFSAQLAETSKMITTPLQLEEDLLQLLASTIIDYSKAQFNVTLVQVGDSFELGSDSFGLENVVLLDVAEVKENWTVVITILVELLTWKHLCRTTPVQDVAAGRFSNLL